MGRRNAANKPSFLPLRPMSHIRCSRLYNGRNRRIKVEREEEKKKKKKKKKKKREASQAGCNSVSYHGAI
jgi:hypothetical protein